MLEQTHIQFLGYIISSEGLCMDPNQIKAVVKWPAPWNIKEIQWLVEFVNFYREFIRDFSKVIALITDRSSFHVHSSHYLSLWNWRLQILLGQLFFFRQRKIRCSFTLVLTSLVWCLKMKRIGNKYSIIPFLNGDNHLKWAIQLVNVITNHKISNLSGTILSFSSLNFIILYQPELRNDKAETLSSTLSHQTHQGSNSHDFQSIPLLYLKTALKISHFPTTHVGTYLNVSILP